MKEAAIVLLYLLVFASLLWSLGLFSRGLIYLYKARKYCKEKQHCENGLNNFLQSPALSDVIAAAISFLGSAASSLVCIMLLNLSQRF